MHGLRVQAAILCVSRVLCGCLEGTCVPPLPCAKRRAYAALGAAHGQLLSMGLPLAALVLVRCYRMPTAAKSLSGLTSGRPRTFA
eukprot:4598049-Pleurochrysis_carterae.AAC.1